MTVPIPSWYLVYLIPYGAVLAILVFARTRISPLALRRTSWLLLVGGLAAMLWALAILPGANRAMFAYRSDPSCAAGLALGVSVAGECSVVDAIVTGGWESFGRRGGQYHAYLDLSFGARKERIQVVQGVELRWSAPDAARVQQFRGRSTLIETSHGTAVTIYRPDQVVLYFELWLIAASAFALLGLAGLFSARARSSPR